MNEGAANPRERERPREERESNEKRGSKTDAGVAHVTKESKCKLLAANEAE